MYLMKTTTQTLEIQSLARPALAESDEQGAALIASLIEDTLNPNTFTFASVAVQS